LSIGAALLHEACGFGFVLRGPYLGLAELKRALASAALPLPDAASFLPSLHDCGQTKNHAPAEPQKRRQGGDNARAACRELRFQGVP
jgi:hypothetical protein